MTVLAVQQLSKGFTFYPSPLARLKARLFNRPTGQHYQALTNISFALAAGDSVGILGKNGAGKSTLLKLITGILLPDTGVVHHEGRITGLLELGTGFDANLTGRENIRVNGLLLGMSEAELISQQVAIIDFAELGDYIDHPVRTYSSGMVMRLGFAIAIHANPRCFIVDEALAVGDARFQQKCIAHIKAYQAQGGTLLFVSHDLNTVKMLCNRALVLDKGNLLYDGDPQQAATHYYRLMAQADGASEVSALGAQQVRIESVQFCDNEQPLTHLTPQQSCQLCFDIQAELTTELTLGFMIKDRFGQEVFGTNSYLMGETLSFVQGNRYQVCFSMTCMLGPGEYTLSASLHRGMSHTDGCQHWLDHALSFQVLAWENYPYVGFAIQPIHALTLSHRSAS